MKKFLVISYYDGCIEVDGIFNTYQEAKEWMDNDVLDFIEPLTIEELDDGKLYIESHSAWAMIFDGMPCDWQIKEIRI